MKYEDSKRDLESILRNFPHDFLDKKQFCLWKYEKLEGSNKPGKIPYYYKNLKFRKLNIKARSNWTSGYNALEIARTYLCIDGIGIILTGSDLFVIDLDNCIDPEVQRLLNGFVGVVDLFCDTYIEVSPSGRGLHILGYGKLDLQGRNKSLKNRNVEAYNSSSVRYITLTGNLWGNQTKLYQYDESSSVLKRFQQSFFPKEQVLPQQTTITELTELNYPIAESGVSNEISQLGGLIDRLDTIVTRIRSSSDSQVFNQLCQGIPIRNSLSEDDFLFCNIVLHNIEKEDCSIRKELIKRMLLKYRYRPKLDRLDYLERTIEKIFLPKYLKYFRENKTREEPNLFLKSYLTSEKQFLIPSSHITKSCPMVQSIFTLSKMNFSSVQEYKVWQNEDNNITIHSIHSLSAIDLSVYIALVELLKQKTFTNQQNKDKNVQDAFLLLGYVSLEVKFVELSKILRRTDGGKFRRNVLKAIQRLSGVVIQYKKSINRDNKIIQGRSNLLSWYSDTDRDQRNYIHIGINKLAWFLLKEATINYCLLNTNVMFNLPSIELRFLYNYICYTVPIAKSYYTKISIDDLANTMWSKAKSKKTYTSRKVRMRKWCQQLHDLQGKLIDCEIRLKYKTIASHSLIDQIYIRRFRAKLRY